MDGFVTCSSSTFSDASSLMMGTDNDEPDTASNPRPFVFGSPAPLGASVFGHYGQDQGVHHQLMQDNVAEVDSESDYQRLSDDSGNDAGAPDEDPSYQNVILPAETEPKAETESKHKKGKSKGKGKGKAKGKSKNEPCKGKVIKGKGKATAKVPKGKATSKAKA